MRILITGGAGFIGHHFVEHFIKNTDWDIVVLDRLNYASFGFDRLRDINCFDDKRISTLTADFTLPIKNGLAQEIGEVDYILHLGAETHVDNSIVNPEPFVMSNVVGTMRMLDFARTLKNLKCFYCFSTDEVMGPAPEGFAGFKEDDRHNPTNPYAATKSGGEMLCIAYRNTYKLPIVITRTMNNFGERQHPEKFIPMVMRKVLLGETVTIHANKERTKAGSRFYIHSRNVADAYLWLINNKFVNQDFHIIGEKEVDNLEMAQFIADTIGKPLRYEMVDFHGSRPGHDLRYALSGLKLKSLGYEFPKTFEDSLRQTIEWSLQNRRWLGL